MQDITQTTVPLEVELAYVGEEGDIPGVRALATAVIRAGSDMQVTPVLHNWGAQASYHTGGESTTHAPQRESVTQPSPAPLRQPQIAAAPNPYDHDDSVYHWRFSIDLQAVKDVARPCSVYAAYRYPAFGCVSVG